MRLKRLIVTALCVLLAAPAAASERMLRVLAEPGLDYEQPSAPWSICSCTPDRIEAGEVASCEVIDLDAPNALPDPVLWSARGDAELVGGRREKSVTIRARAPGSIRVEWRPGSHCDTVVATEAEPRERREQPSRGFMSPLGLGLALAVGGGIIWALYHASQDAQPAALPMGVR